jgi:hypothetical protein
MEPADLMEVYVYRTASGLTIHHSERVNGQYPEGKWVKVPRALVATFVETAVQYRAAVACLHEQVGEQCRDLPLNFATIYAPSLVAASSVCTRFKYVPGSSCTNTAVIQFRLVQRDPETWTMITVTSPELACPHHALEMATAYREQTLAAGGWSLDTKMLRSCTWCSDYTGVCVCTGKCNSALCQAALASVLA